MEREDLMIVNSSGLFVFRYYVKELFQQGIRCILLYSPFNTYHHEKWDGTGYPNGLNGKNIPLAARIFADVDVWDALTSDRPYRSAWSREKTIDYIKSETGKHFDPEVVTAFLRLVESQESARRSYRYATS